MDESKLLYTATHEWLDVHGDIATIGITRFAVEQLTDIVYVELPAVGKKLATGATFGVIESVKAVSDLYAPMAGEVVEVNKAVANDPSILSTDPYEKGWMIKLRLDGPLETLKVIDKAAYDQMIAHGHVPH